MVKVKICGLTNLADAFKAYELGADFLGFIFFEESLRKLKPTDARLIIRELPRKALKVGLFLDQDIDTVRETAEKCGLDFLQLHGTESQDYCAQLKKNFKIIKSFKARDRGSIEAADDYAAADFYLFDTFVKGLAGGTGKSFDWDILSGKEFKRPVFLAGGLTPKNVLLAIKKVLPYGVDVASGVEKAPGRKDYRLLKEFIDNAKVKLA